jgi:hypothetical protein
LYSDAELKMKIYNYSLLPHLVLRKFFKVSFLRQCGEFMDVEEFAKCLEGKTLEEIVHKAKKESEKRMLAQGIAPIALFVSEILLETYEKESKNVLH